MSCAGQNLSALAHSLSVPGRPKLTCPPGTCSHRDARGQDRNDTGPLKKLLSSNEAPEENHKEKLLHFAVGYGRKEAVQILLDAKADPNWQSLDGRNALHECCISGAGWRS